MPSITGAHCNLLAGIYYVNNKDDFTFRVTPEGSNIDSALLVTTSRTSIPDSIGVIIDKDEDGIYTVTIQQIEETVEIFIHFVNHDFGVSSERITSHQLWYAGNMLYVNSDIDDVLNIYTISGTFVQKSNIKAGETVIIQLLRGVYFVMIHNRSYKIIIK